MIKNGIEKIVELLFNGNVKEMILGITSDAIAVGVEHIVQTGYFCICMEEFLRHQENEIVKEQLEIIIQEIRNNIQENVQEQNLNLIFELESCLNTKFEEYDISNELRISLIKNLIQYVLVYIYKFDRAFYRDIVIKMELREDQQNIQKIEIRLEELEQIAKELELKEKNSIPITAGTNRLNIRDITMIDKREVEIAKIEEKFSQENNVVFLYGRPGIGKTTLARLYANKFSEKNEGDVTIYFVRYGESIENTITKISRDPKKYNGKDILQYWKNSEAEKNARVLLIIDNFNEDKLQGKNRRAFEEELSGEYFEALKDTGIHILITTRIRVREDVYNVSTVSDTVGLFKRYAKVENLECDEQIILQIVEVLRGNTMLIVLSAYLWAKNKNNGELLLEALKKGKLEDFSANLSKQADIDLDENEKTIYGQAKALLDFSDILKDSNVKEVFTHMALLPLCGFSKELFIALLGSGSADIIDELINASWILEENGVIFFHPVVREIVRKKNLITYDIVKKYCEDIGEKIKIGANFTNRLRYKECAWEIFDIFSEKKKMDVTLVKLMYSLSDIYDEIAERKRSLKITKVVYKHLYVFEDDLLEKAACLSGIAYSVNNCYKNMKDLNKAAKMLKQAAEIYKDILPNTVKDKTKYKQLPGKIWSNKGSNYLAKGHCNQTKCVDYYKKALECHKKALEIREANRDSFMIDEEKYVAMNSAVAISYTNLGTTYFHLKQYKLAMDYHKKAYDIRKKSYLKSANDNQQRIIGCAIEQYRSQFYIEIEDLSQVLSYYPELIRDNCRFEVYKSLEININYFIHLSTIILNDKRYESLIDDVIQKKDSIASWLKIDSKLYEKYGVRVEQIGS